MTLAPLLILSSFEVHDVSVATILAVGAATTVIVLFVLAVQPLTSVAVTE